MALSFSKISVFLSLAAFPCRPQHRQFRKCLLCVKSKVLACDFYLAYLGLFLVPFSTDYISKSALYCHRHHFQPDRNIKPKPKPNKLMVKSTLDSTSLFCNGETMTTNCSHTLCSWKFPVVYTTVYSLPRS